MDERRSERFSVSLTPSELADLDAYAAEHRWSRSTAAAELIQRGLASEAAESALKAAQRGGGTVTFNYADTGWATATGGPGKEQS